MRVIAVLTLVQILGIGAASAQDWPSRPIKMIVPFAAGGATDIGARVLAEDLSKELGQPVVVENRGGAGGNIGVEATAQSAPDGYTIMMGTQALITFNPHLYANLKVDPRKELAPVGMAFATDMIMVASPKLPDKTLKGIIAQATAQPGKLSYGSAGNGSGAHILMELFRSMAKVDIVHVPYRGTAPALTDLVTGSLDLMIDSVPSSLGQIKGGNVVAVAICGSKRNPRLPDVPTFAEAALPDYSAAAWLAVFAPAKTPPEIIAKTNAAMKRSLAKPDVQARAFQSGIDAEWSGSEDLKQRIAQETELWGGVIKRANIVVN